MFFTTFEYIGVNSQIKIWNKETKILNLYFVLLLTKMILETLKVVKIGKFVKFVDFFSLENNFKHKIEKIVIKIKAQILGYSYIRTPSKCASTFIIVSIL